MAGYTLKGKVAGGGTVDIPLAAQYDSEGNEIVSTYATKEEMATIEEIIKYRLPLGVATWSQINTIAQLGIAPQVWKIGDEKKVELSTGEEIIVQIWDFNHDTLTGGGRAAITFGLKDALSTAYKMNNTNTNVGGWTSSLMRTSTLATIFDQLPEDMQDIIKYVDKKTSKGNKQSALDTTSDQLWLPSNIEVFGSYNWRFGDGGQNAFWGEGYQYEIFARAPLPTFQLINEISTLSQNGCGTFFQSPTATGYDYFTDRFGNEIEMYTYDEDYGGDDRTAYLYNYASIKGLGIDTTGSYWWWLRSPYYGDTNNFCYVGNNGDTDYNSAGNAGGVVFGFCI